MDMDDSAVMAYLDQRRASCTTEIGNIAESVAQGLQVEGDSTGVWAKLACYFFDQCSTPEGADAISALLAEASIRLSRVNTVPGVVSMELTELRRQVVALTHTLREVRWRLRATQYPWLVDEELDRNAVQVPDEQWDRWQGR